MRYSVFILVFLFFSLLIVTPGQAAPLAISNIYIEPTGYEDPTTHEWKGSFWFIVATTDTKESYLFYKFNQSQSEYFGQNKIGNKTIVPTSTIKITITPRQPYWERPLKVPTQPWMVYPKTYGTWLYYPTKDGGKIKETYVPALYAEVLCCDIDDLWTRHTPFDVTVEKIGTNAFTQTVTVDTVGGTEELVLRNPADSSEKLMISNLGQLGTGYGQPSIDEIVVFEKGTQSIAFDRTKVEKAIKYGRDLEMGVVLEHECYAFYWFGGGKRWVSTEGEVEYFRDDKSPGHYVLKPWRSLVEDDEFPGSYRNDSGFMNWDQRALPIAGSIWEDNTETNPSGNRSLSLINYLKSYVCDKVDLNKYWGQGWTITADNKLRIYMPNGAASSLITIKISTELADSVVYQPIVGNGKIEQAFWDSTKTTKSSIKDKETAVLKVKQYAPNASKITVTPSIPANVPVSVSPLMNSAIVDPNAVHTFQFEIRNLGTQVNQSSTITFTITNDLGTVTDTVTLDFDLLVIEEPQPNHQPEDTGIAGDPLWIWLAAVISITIATASIYGVYTYRSSRKGTLEKKEQSQ